MVESLATRHRQKVTAGDTVPANTPQAVQGDYDRLMIVALQADKARLKRLRSRHKKDQLKAELLDKYRDYLTSIINHQQAAHNEVLVVVCLWSIDASDYKTALTLASYALSQGMLAPEGFKRTLPEVIAEEISEKVLKMANPGDMRGTLLQIMALLEEADIFDEVSAKLYKALGLAWMSEDKAQALQSFLKAQSYGAAVKRHITRLRKEVENT